MAAPRVERRLTAVLAADIVGYSRLMERDEPGTHERVQVHRKELLEPLITEHRGRIVKLTGDGALCEFQSVVDAVEKLLSCCIPTKESGEKKPMPPLVEFQWGGTKSFPAFVTQVNAKYTRFASNGVPIRAVCTVNLEEMPPNDKRKQPKQNPTSGVFAVERVHTMISGDNLALVAYDEYGDPALWRALAAYNGFDDPMRIANGTRILLPPAEELLA